MALPSAIRIDAYPTQVQARTLILTGTNNTDIATVRVSGVPAAVTQPTSTTWTADVRLSPGTNTLLISGIDVAGNVSSSFTITITVLALTQTQRRVFNVFDEFGVFLSLPRLPGEKNLPYRNRLNDVNVHVADTTVRGYTFGTSRSLGVQIRPAFRLRTPLNPDTGTTRAIGGSFRARSVWFDLRAGVFHTTECHRVEPATQEIVLDRDLVDATQLTLTTAQGDAIALTDWELDAARRTVRFLTPDYNGAEISAVYFYIERISLVDITLGQLKTAIEAFVTSEGDPIFEFTGLIDGNELAENIVPIPVFVPINENNTTVEVSKVRTRELADYDYQQSQLNDRGHAIDTKLAQWAKRINNESRIVWSSAQLGDSIWEPLGEEPRLGALPHLTDAERGHWACLKGDHGTRFTRKDFRRYNGSCPNDGEDLKYHGVLPKEFQSGTGTQDDLKVLKIVAV
jgi:hypothetical protein